MARRRAKTAPPPKVTGDDVTDGRRLRSSRSRAKIVRALLTVIRSGDMTPSAARVAEVAGVSLRTVFRHFDDMDTLHREMAAIVEVEVRPIMAPPLRGETWRERLDELIGRRTQVFEHIMPYRVAGSLRRFTSTYLMQDYRKFVAMERETLLGVLPQTLIADAMLTAALEMTTGFQAWRRMRQDQQLSAVDARAVMLFTVDRLLAGRRDQFGQ